MNRKIVTQDDITITSETTKTTLKEGKNTKDKNKSDTHGETGGSK